MVTHIPKFLELCKSVKIFTGPGLRKTMVWLRVIPRKSNKWGAARDVLRQEQRQGGLQNHEREAYVK